MKGLERRNKTYKLNNLPELKAYSFILNGKVGYTGSIVRRRIQGPVKIYWHYAFIYGFDKQDRLLLIENNSDGVECITWEDFKLDFYAWEFTHIEETPTRHQEIMLRAIEKMTHIYEGGENNCEHFVNYCVFKRLESAQSDNTKVIAHVLTSLLELRIKISTSPRDHELLKEINDVRKLLKIESDYMNKILEKNKSSKTPVKN